MEAQIRPDSTEDIARAIAIEHGREEYWRYYHPIVKWTIQWLDERHYLAIVDNDGVRLGVDDA